MMTCVIIDDEPKAIDLLKLYCGRLSDIEVAASFRDPVEALQYLNTNKVDIIFLDINMPKVNGLALAKILGEGAPIVFTTAYAEHAVESYDLGAVDYLLKPISFDRFFKCVEKFKSDLSTTNHNDQFISVKSGSIIHRLKPMDILYLEKDGNYCYYYTKDQKIMARKSVTEALSKLPATFIQIHKSIIINTQQVSQFSSDQVVIHSKSLPVSETYRKGTILALSS
jgi:DNA-binding LytR/AlgR family response regulator